MYKKASTRTGGTLTHSAKPDRSGLYNLRKQTKMKFNNRKPKKANAYEKMLKVEQSRFSEEIDRLMRGSKHK